MDKVLELLRKIAKQQTWYDDPDFLVCDYAGGNIDDAYYGGTTDGETRLARGILAMIGESHEEEC